MKALNRYPWTKEQGGFQGLIASASINEPLHSVSWRVHCSAVDDVEVIEASNESIILRKATDQQRNEISPWCPTDITRN